MVTCNQAAAQGSWPRGTTHVGDAAAAALSLASAASISYASARQAHGNRNEIGQNRQTQRDRGADVLPPACKHRWLEPQIQMQAGRPCAVYVMISHAIFTGEPRDACMREEPAIIALAR